LTKTEAEIFIIKEFLEKGLRLPLFWVTAQKPPQPDALVEIADGRLFEIEHTDYQYDQQANGGSPGRKLAAFWEAVIKHICYRQKIRAVYAEASVRLKDHADLGTREVVPFADELFAFAEEYQPEQGRKELKCFAGYPLLFKYAEEIAVWPTQGRTCCWSCSNVNCGSVAVVPKEIARAIKTKSGKLYTWADGAVKCLLIVASGASLSSSAGPHGTIAEWQSPELEDACRTAPFDRVYFWEGTHHWHHVLK